MTNLSDHYPARILSLRGVNKRRRSDEGKGHGAVVDVIGVVMNEWSSCIKGDRSGSSTTVIIRRLIISPFFRRKPIAVNMPHALPQLFKYDHVPETKEELDWADRESHFADQGS